MVLEVYREKLRRRMFFLVLLIGIFFLSIFLGISIGCVDIPLNTVWEIIFNHYSENRVYLVIIWEIRIPRVLIAAFVGAALAVSGCLIQSILRNPLASPYVLGLSSGAAFGAALLVALDLWLIIPIPLSAFVFSIIAFLITYRIALEDGRLPISSLILAGMAVAAFFSAMTSFMMYLAGEKLEVIVFWLMGGLYGLSWDELKVVMIGITPLLILSLFLGKDLNAMMLGDDVAKSLGVEVDKIRKLTIVIVSLMVAICVAYTGPIGFVGLMVPHMVRFLIGSDNRFLIPASIFFGGSFLVLTDLLARTLMRPAEIPIGIITSLFGVPFFIYLLKRRKGLMKYVA